MAEENVELARLGYEAVNRADLDGLLNVCAPQIEWEDLATVDVAAVTGKDAVRIYFETVLDPWEEYRREPEEIVDLGGDRVLVLYHATGRGKESGIEVDVRAGDLLTIRKGRLVRWIAYPDQAQALEAAGLSE